MRLAIAVAIALVLVGTGAFAGMNTLNKVAVHVKSHPTSCTGNYPSFPSCTSIQYQYAGCGDIDVMPVFYDAVRFTGVEFSLSWSNNPLASMTWTRCQGDGSMGNIVHPGDGTVITWSTCQTAYSVAPGYGWITVSNPDEFCAWTSPMTHRCGMTDCSPSPGPYFDGSIVYSCGGVCGGLGRDPCAPDASEQTTWGAIKALIR
jgi:hypothetical protein